MTRYFTDGPPTIVPNPNGSGLWCGGRQLSMKEAAKLGIRPRPEARMMSPEQPPIRVPKYEGLRPLTRDEIVDLFRSSWNGDPAITTHDVGNYLKEHQLQPVGHVPPRVLAEITEDMDHHDRMRAHRQNEEHRESSRRARELYDLNGLPKFIPSHRWPSNNDSYELNLARIRYINEEL